MLAHRRALLLWCSALSNVCLWVCAIPVHLVALSLTATVVNKASLPIAVRVIRVLGCLTRWPVPCAHLPVWASDVDCQHGSVATHRPDDVRM